MNDLNGQEDDMTGPSIQRDQVHWIIRNAPFIIGLVAQSVCLAVVGGWQLSKIDSRVAGLEDADKTIRNEWLQRRTDFLIEYNGWKLDVTTKMAGIGLLSERMIRSETTLDNVKSTVNRIENKLDRIDNNNPGNGNNPSQQRN